MVGGQGGQGGQITGVDRALGWTGWTGRDWLGCDYVAACGASPSPVYCVKLALGASAGNKQPGSTGGIVSKGVILQVGEESAPARTTQVSPSAYPPHARCRMTGRERAQLLTPEGCADGCIIVEVCLIMRR